MRFNISFYKLAPLNLLTNIRYALYSRNVLRMVSVATRRVTMKTRENAASLITL